MNRFKKYLGLALCIFMVGLTPITSLADNKTTSKSDTKTQEEKDKEEEAKKALKDEIAENIKKKQEEIDKAKEEKDALESGLTDVKQIKKKLENEKANLSNYVAQLDSTLEEILAKIADLKAKIYTKEAEIAVAEEELAAAEQKAADQRAAMIKRMKLMYEMGGNQIYNFLFASANFRDLLNKSDYIEMVMKYDQKMFDEFVANAELVDLCRQDLETEKQILEIAKNSVEVEQANLETLIDQKTADIQAYQSDINNKEAVIKEYEEDLKRQNEEIEALEQAIMEERRRLLETNGVVTKYDGGVFKFPLANYTRVSDDYGYRIHPILKVEQFHNGIDFAAPAGTAIYAAYDGKVVAATYSDSMGNYVMIDHGDSLYTIYMHASALYVKKGDVVVRGDTIAAVGTTGRSTGNHLHFSVRRNGSYESPWAYISK